MKPLIRTFAFVTVAGVMFASSALAQPEQWLRYSTDDNPKAYRWIELTTNAPDGVALPKLNDYHFFGRWTTPMDPKGGRWICLDRKGRSGPCDQLYIDTNGDGRLDDENPITSMNRSSSYIYFNPAKLVFQSEDGPIAYHLIMRFYQFDNERAQLLVGSSGWYEGKVELAGKKRSIQLQDGNVNGVFNDISSDPAEADRIVIGDSSTPRRLGRFIEVDGQLLAIEVARDGAFIKVKPAENVTFGAVKMPDTITEFNAVGENGEFVRKPEKGECQLPVGHYRVNGWTIDRKDDRGASWSLTGSGFTEFGSFDVTSNAPAFANVGEPIQPALTINETPTGASFSLRLKGGLGETLEILKGSERPRAPRLELASKGGAFDSTYTFEYG